MHIGEGHGNTLQDSCLKTHGQRNLAGYSLWGCKESDTAKQLILYPLKVKINIVFCTFSSV